MENQVKNMRAIRVKFLGATNNKGSRIKLIEQMYKTTDTITLSYDYAIGNGTEQAIKYLQNKGINILGKSDVKGETILFSNSWQKGNDDFITIKNK
tara:strand:- start:40 stop:327 length:288 start_codon:yes stop_codon:yes gene_type:complete